MRQAKLHANDTMIQNFSNPTKSIWSNINMNRGNTNTNTNGNKISPHDFNNFFTKTADVAKNIPNTGHNPFRVILT